MLKKEKIWNKPQKRNKRRNGNDDIEMTPGFKETIKYFFNAEGKNILKFVTFFLAKKKQKRGDFKRAFGVSVAVRKGC
jgi:hypothetical protein